MYREGDTERAPRLQQFHVVPLRHVASKQCDISVDIVSYS